MTQTSFYSDTPNFATDFPTQNDSAPTTGNTPAPSSFYPNGGAYVPLAVADDVLANVQAAAAAASNSAAAAATSATNAASAVRVGICADRAALAAVDTAKFVAAILIEAGREGTFLWKTGDYSALITADASQGVYVKATAVAATAGSWVRVATDHLCPEWFGALKNGTNDDSVAINAASAIAGRLGIPWVILSGTYTLASSLVPVSGVVVRGNGAGARLNINTNVAVLLTQANAPLVRGGLENIKFVNSNPANTLAIGMQLDACQRCSFKDLDFFNYDAGAFALIQPTVVYSGANAAIYGPDYHNFVFNEFRNIMVAKCNYGMVFRGGTSATPGTVTNVITLNDYYNVCLRQVMTQGILSDYWHDNDHFHSLYMMLSANNAIGLLLSGGHVSSYIGVSSHHFYSPTIVFDPSVAWTGMAGIYLRNAPGCLFIGLAADGLWPVNNTFIVNTLGVELYVLSSYMHVPVGDTGLPATTNRLAHVTQNTLTRQSGSVTVGAGATSVAVTFPQTLLQAPSAGAGEVRLTPYSDPGVRYWVDYTTITATGFTMRFSAATPAAFPMLWSAEVFKAS